jgi:transposase-like protein
MYGREQRVLLRHYLERGLSKADIARELGVSRRTVYHWIESAQHSHSPGVERGLHDAERCAVGREDARLASPMVNTWVKFRCKSPLEMGQFSLQINILPT